MQGAQETPVVSRGWEGGGNDNSLQYSCLENPMDSCLEGYRPWGSKESDTA